MTLKGKKILVLIGPGFEELEFFVPVMRMQEAEAEVVVAGEKAGKYYFGKHGNCMEGKADISFDEVDPASFDAVIVPGGWAPDKIRRIDAVKKIVKTMYDADKIVGMICHAGLVGISAGIVEGHDATGSLGIKDDIENAGASWRDEPAFRSGNIVWGRVVPDIPYFNRELIKALED
ncbi:MAG: type 1 glutamine amidotransferase domain-containing protein [Brevefilum sp.]|nr:type 1 glutamine amidotransferase [Brevefilum sp.]MDT8382590.1 type 1 glutamine amidotransferase domain-containing protein [Brevefilum sp.]MDW7754765.1 type 1 glutamine amidotransferase domain-containing protein [Brevefilum sp.]